jgi:hypothetical protein
MIRRVRKVCSRNVVDGASPGVGELKLLQKNISNHVCHKREIEDKTISVILC